MILFIKITKIILISFTLSFSIVARERNLTIEKTDKVFSIAYMKSYQKHIDGLVKELNNNLGNIEYFLNKLNDQDKKTFKNYWKKYKISKLPKIIIRDNIYYAGKKELVYFTVSDFIKKQIWIGEKLYKFSSKKDLDGIIKEIDRGSVGKNKKVGFSENFLKYIGIDAAEAVPLILIPMLILGVFIVTGFGWYIREMFKDNIKDAISMLDTFKDEIENFRISCDNGLTAELVNEISDRAKYLKVFKKFNSGPQTINCRDSLLEVYDIEEAKLNERSNIHKASNISKINADNKVIKLESQINSICTTGYEIINCLKKNQTNINQNTDLKDFLDLIPSEKEFLRGIKSK